MKWRRSMASARIRKSSLPNYWPTKIIPFGRACCMGLPAAMGKLFRWRFRRSGISAASLIGRGMVFPGALNGARVSFRGARTNAGISKTVLSRSSRAVFKALIGSRSAGFGRITATSRVPVTSSFLTGMMKADRTGYPTMWVSSKRSRMAASTR